MEVITFAFPGPLRDKLVAAVLSGKKTATTGLAIEGDADLSLAHDEGEDFQDVAQWRVAHERLWNDEVIPTLPAGTLSGLTDDTEVLVWRFRLARH